MMNPRLQSRIVRGCGLAALDYAAAANQAYFETASHVIAFWAKTLGSPDDEVAPRSWYRHPDTDRPVSSAAADTGFNFGFNNIFANQVAAWQAMATAPWTLSPAAWPSAFTLMAIGIPKSVAWPTSEANAAMTDAAQAAAETFETTCSSYRSDGGHAVAQIIMLPVKTALGTAAAVPFLDLLQDATQNWASLFMPPRGI